MDSFFGIGFAELIVILVLAGLVMGPARIRQVARTLGRWTGQLQAISREFARQLNAELDSLDDGGDMKATMKEMRELQREVQNLRHELNQVPKSFIQDTKSAVEEGKAIMEGKEPTYKQVSRPREERENGTGNNETGATETGATSGLPKAIDVPEDRE